jgi:tripartite-type tricarboxylate transporter receptor subunit TctC
MHRRDFLQCALASVAVYLGAQAVGEASGWPEKPVKIILPYAPGGATDAIARPWAEKLSEAFGQQFVIENRGGASGMIGVEAAVKSAPDGYTFLLTPNSAIAIIPSLRKAPYDATKQLEPVARVGESLAVSLFTRLWA